MSALTMLPRPAKFPIWTCACLACRFHFMAWPLSSVCGLDCRVCLDYRSTICPRCGSHDVAIADGQVVDVDPAVAASVRASVWGRAN